jgi:hypothetical protein
MRQSSPLKRVGISQAAAATIAAFIGERSLNPIVS